MKNVILGVNAYHADSSACVVIDGELIAAAEEERFCRLKHWAGFPSKAIRYCLDEADVGLHDVDHVAVNRDPKANLFRKARFVVTNRPSPALIRERLANAKAWMSIEDELRSAFPGEGFQGTLHRVEHHRAHLSSGFLVSPYEDAVCLSVDGFGDFASTAWGLGRGGAVSIDGRVFFPHSFGVFYQALTQFIGFPHYGDEYKVMGLAPYGEPTYAAALRNVLLARSDGTFELNLKFFRHHRESTSYVWNNQIPETDALYSDELVELLGPPRAPEEDLSQRHKDIARSAQVVYEEAFFNLLRVLHHKYDCGSLVLSGGCAQNSVANGKIYAETSFRRVYIPAAAPDAGGAIGAAAHVWHSLNGRAAQHTVSDSPFTGPSYSDAQITELLERVRTELAQRHCVLAWLDDEAMLCERAARSIADAKVVGWFQGRMEWGPRALGNRSIICDPRRADMKQILNRKIKRRESFRPFAPSVLRSAVRDWFETDDDVPFMNKVFTIREDKRQLVPAVTHVDGSGRLQTVDEAMNLRYCRLISAFAALTDVPMVLNTSFNENEPIVCAPEEALDCFLRTDMDVLVLNNAFIERVRERQL